MGNSLQLLDALPDILYHQENQISYRSFIKELEKNRGMDCITILAGVQN